jgi:hypothetical protein
METTLKPMKATIRLIVLGSTCYDLPSINILEAFPNGTPNIPAAPMTLRSASAGGCCCDWTTKHRAYPYQNA